MLAPPPPTAQPPRPTSASSHGKFSVKPSQTLIAKTIRYYTVFVLAGNLMGRNKHVRDPSVQSGVGSFPLNPIDSQSAYGNRQNNNAFHQLQQYPQSNFNPLQANTSVPPLVPMQSSVPAAVPSAYPGVANPADAVYNAAYYRNVEQATDALQGNIHQSAPGWNDPPALTSSLKSQVPFASPYILLGLML